MNSLRSVLELTREYNRLVNIGEIARRYFAMNAFDGVLTIIGVLMGNFTARVADPQIVISTGLATCVAMGISGLWGAYLTEAAERKSFEKAGQHQDDFEPSRFLSSLRETLRRLEENPSQPSHAAIQQLLLC